MMNKNVAQSHGHIASSYVSYWGPISFYVLEKGNILARPVSRTKKLIWLLILKWLEVSLWKTVSVIYIMS